ncbi:MAG: hypothetical protein ACLT3H_09000 [Roseburia sp.]
MRRSRCVTVSTVIGMILMAGCSGAGTFETNQQTSAGKKVEQFLSAEDAEVSTIIAEYAEETEYPELAQFLISYYQIPEEYRGETRYYYNYVDLNEDGQREIFAVVIGEYTEVPFGDPAVILTEEEGSFAVIEDFAGVRTPIRISEMTTNGWHDIMYQEYGGDKEDGYRICRYSPDGGYQTSLSEVVGKMEPVGGTNILSNNLIDDMDQGRYLTLVPQEKK